MDSFGNENKANHHTSQLIWDEKQNFPNLFTKKLFIDWDSLGEFTVVYYGIMGAVRGKFQLYCMYIGVLVSGYKWSVILERSCYW